MRQSEILYYFIKKQIKKTRQDIGRGALNNACLVFRIILKVNQ